MCDKLAPVLKERQTAYLQGRLINDNLRSIIATSNIANLEERCNGLVVSLDAKKAFDSVSHKYIERCLIKFGLRKFVPIFQILYKNLRTDIIINGKIIKGYDILRGVKQGDALSCIIFIMSIEPFLLNVENNPNIKPIRSELLNKDLPKAYAYADDVNPTIRDDNESLKELFKEYGNLTKASGLYLNADKTEILRLGRNEGEKEYEVDYLERKYRIKTQPIIKINGIKLQRDLVKMVDDNVDAVVEKMDKQFISWSRRGLSILGRILIAKTFGISQAIYLMQTMCLNETHFKRLNHVIFKYIWNRRYAMRKAPERIKRDIMNTSIKEGGFGMINIEELDDSLKLRALGRLLTTEHPFLKLIREQVDLNSYLNPVVKTEVESVASRGIELMKIDRAKLIEKEEMSSDARFLAQLRKERIKHVISSNGQNSIAYYLLSRRGKRKLEDLDRDELRSLERFISKKAIPVIRQVVSVNVRNTNGISSCLYINNKFKDITSCLSKEIRISRSRAEVIKEWKIGLRLDVRDSLTYSLRISRLTSIHHKSMLLRVLHGDIYTKDKLNRYGMIDSDKCPRCDNAETLIHKVLECPYVDRIWRSAANTLGVNLQNHALEKILGAHKECDQSKLAIHCEIIKRILYLKDDETYLIRPKILVKQSLEHLYKMERRLETRATYRELVERFN
jgi:hypothetical protein